MAHSGPSWSIKPDSAWSWLVACCNCLTGILLYGMFRSMAVFYLPIMDEFGVEYRDASLITALSVTGTAIGALLLPMTRKYGSRITGIGAGLTLGISTFISSLSLNLIIIQIFQGFINGLAAGVLVCNMVLTCNEYFDKHKAKAVGIAMLGIPVGGIILPPTLNALIELYGWRAALQIMSAVSLHTCITASLYRPVYRDQHGNSLNEPNKDTSEVELNKKSATQPSEGTTTTRASGTSSHTKAQSSEEDEPEPTGPDKSPTFLEGLEDRVVRDGSIGYRLTVRVGGIPAPVVKWYLEDDEIEDSDDFKYETDAQTRTLVFAEIFPEDCGTYTCVAKNAVGEARAHMKIIVEDADPPSFITKPRSLTVNAGATATLTCIVGGDRTPTVEWSYYNRPIQPSDRVKITTPSGSNSLHTLEISQATIEDAGPYTVCSRNRFGRTTKIVSVIVNAPKNQQENSDFRKVLKSSSSKQEQNEPSQLQQEIKPCNALPSSEGPGTVKNRPRRNSVEMEHFRSRETSGKREAPGFVAKLPTAVEVIEGDEDTFGCQVKGDPQPRVTWTRNGGSLSVLNYENEEGEASVNIHKAGKSDVGKYVCTASNISGESDTSCVVAGLPRQEMPKPSFIRQLEDMQIEESRHIRLECEVAKVPKVEIIWMHDGQKLEADDGESSFKNGIARLVLFAAMTEDSGLYECIAKARSVEAKTSCNVVVTPEMSTEEGPSFPVQLEDMTVDEDKDIHLICQVKGNPRPTISWLIDGEPLDSEFKYSEDGTVDVSLPGALPDNEGVYTCIAQNKSKRVMCSCTVTVKAKPKSPRSNRALPEAKIELNKKSVTQPSEGTTTTRASGTSSHTKAQSSEEDEPQPTGPDKSPTFLEGLEDRIVLDGSIGYRLTARVGGIPAPVVKWYHEDDEIEDSDDFKYETDAQTRTLVFAEIFPEDCGTYICVAKNAVGEARAKMKIIVKEIDGDPPSFIRKPWPLTVNAGATATLTCIVDGDPTPTVKWLYCNRPIQPSDRVKITIPSFNNTLHMLEILQATIEDAGLYTACSSNLLGNTTCTVPVIVKATKNQQENTDFRKVLKPSSSKKITNEPSQPQQDSMNARMTPTGFSTSQSQMKSDEMENFGRRGATGIVIFDWKSEHLQLFNTADNTLKQMQSFNKCDKINSYTAVTLRDFVYVLMSNKSVLRLKFSDERATWDRMPDMIDICGRFSPATVMSGCIYVATGDYRRSANALEKFDPSSNKWSLHKQKQMITNGNVLVVAQGFMYSIGGRSLQDVVLNEVERFDPVSSIWTFVEPMNRARLSPGAVEFNGKIFVLGGFSGSVPLSCVEIYDPSTNAWLIMENNMLKPRWSFSAFVINGAIYAVSGDKEHKSIEKYSFEKDVWEEVHIQTEKRIYIHASTKI